MPLLSDPNVSNDVSLWAKANGHPLPGKRVVTIRLVEEGLALPSSDGLETLEAAHAALIRAHDGSNGMARP